MLDIVVVMFLLAVVMMVVSQFPGPPKGCCPVLKGA